jgi:hypothetical protein
MMFVRCFTPTRPLLLKMHAVLVDVLGVHNIWWYINALGNVISRE